MGKEALRSHPTSAGWELELRRLVEGERAYEIGESGSIQEYLRGVMAASHERPVAQAAFNEALRNIVQSWQPSIIESTPRVARMLDLIAAFTPPAGFPKVMELLGFWEYGVESVVSESIHARRKDLRMKALMTLAAYFPVAAPLYVKEEPGFRAYAYLLRGHLLRDEPTYSGYAASRLLGLHLIEPEGDEIKALIRSNPAALREIVPLLLARHTALSDISSVYGQCLLTDEKRPQEELRSALKACGAAIEVPGTWPENWPELRLRDGRRLPLEMSEAVEAVYVSKQRWEMEADEGHEIWESVQVTRSNEHGGQTVYLDTGPASGRPAEGEGRALAAGAGQGGRGRVHVTEVPNIQELLATPLASDQSM